MFTCFFCSNIQFQVIFWWGSGNISQLTSEVSQSFVKIRSRNKRAKVLAGVEKTSEVFLCFF